MIGALLGRILRLGPESCILDVQGVGYHVCLHARLVSSFCLEQKISLWIESLVHEGQTTLFGFVDPQEQEWFLSLIKISGISGRLAQKILSVCPPSTLVQAILKKEVHILKQAEGVGERLATRLVNELKDTVHKKSSLFPVQPPLSADVLQALLSLGYRPNEAQIALNQVLSKSAGLDEEAILTACLQVLSG